MLRGSRKACSRQARQWQRAKRCSAAVRHRDSDREAPKASKTFRTDQTREDFRMPFQKRKEMRSVSPSSDRCPFWKGVGLWECSGHAHRAWLVRSFRQNGGSRYGVVFDYRVQCLEPAPKRRRRPSPPPQSHSPPPIKVPTPPVPLGFVSAPCSAPPPFPTPFLLIFSSQRLRWLMRRENARTPAGHAR
jgi:hypothetical protein